MESLLSVAENLIPISIFLRQKKDVDRLADLRPNSSLNPTYQAYFEALLTPSPTEQQHPTDRAAVVKYIRRRERRRRAEANRKTFEVSEDILEKVGRSAGPEREKDSHSRLCCSANGCIDGENRRCGHQAGT